jgi:hypothetical protein
MSAVWLALIGALGGWLIALLTAGGLSLFLIGWMALCAYWRRER